MDVILIRHGKAGERDAAQWPNDDLRPLTKDGAAEQRAVAQGLRRMGVEFDFLVTSPLVRARQTADIFSEVFEWDEPAQESDALGHDCTTRRVVQLLAKFPPDATVALVGHEPALSRVAAELTGKAGDARIELKKGGMAGISFEGAAAIGAGALAFLMKPGHLKKAGKARRR